MTKLVIDGAAKAANGAKLNPAGAKLSPRDARTVADTQAAVDAAAVAGLAAPVKAAAAAMAHAKPGLALGQLAKLGHADLAKLVKHDDDTDPKHRKDDDNSAPADSQGQGEHLAMVDGASAASAGLLVTDVVQDTSASGGSSDDDRNSDILPIALAGGAIAIGTIILVSGGGNGNGGGTPTPTNTAPTFAAATGTGTVAENSAITTVAIKATATDANAGDTITYSLTGADAALFAINSTTGEVTFKASPDFETPLDTGKDNVYEFNVVATDKAGLTATQAEKITVTNVNETPAVTSAATASVTENTTATVYTITSKDVDAGDTITYSIGGTDAALFSVDKSTGAVKFNAGPDFENPTDAGKDNVYDITVTATDKGGLASAAQAVKITVTGVNEAPTITSGATALPLAENSATSTVVYLAAGKDQDAGDTFTFSIGGADAALFNIDKSTGAVTFKASPDFENPLDTGKDNTYDFTVTATDKAGLASAAQAVSFKVTDVNEAPSFAKTTDTGAAIAENATGTVAYTAAATDPDKGDVLTYKLGGADAGSFTIDSATGVVTVATAFNYEASLTHTYTFTVTATDKAGLATATPVTVTGTVTDVFDNLTLDVGKAGSAVTIDAAGANPPNVLDVNYNFTETPAVSEVLINNFAKNDHITISGADAVDYNYAAIGTNLVITSLAANGDFSTITLNNALNAGATVNSEATAELALTAKLGASDNAAAGGYIVSAPAPVVTISDDTSTGTTVSAAGKAVTFTDDAKVNSTVTITNFRADDSIAFTNSTGGSLNFSTVFGDTKDVKIDVFDSTGSFLSTIILDNAGSGAAVFDQHSAAVALGRADNFITFA